MFNNNIFRFLSSQRMSSKMKNNIQMIDIELNLLYQKNNIHIQHHLIHSIDFSNFIKVTITRHIKIILKTHQIYKTFHISSHFSCNVIKPSFFSPSSVFPNAFNAVPSIKDLRHARRPIIAAEHSLSNCRFMKYGQSSDLDA